jgi:zinc/manganese transport system ATP-binding protein
MFAQLSQALPPRRNDPPPRLPITAFCGHCVALDNGGDRPSPALELEDAAFGYARRPAVAALTGVFASGSLTALIGPNGAGKSTLLKGLAGELAPLRGQVLRPASARTAYLPQQSELDPTFPASVGQTVAFGLARGADGPHRKAQVARALDAVGLSGFEAVSLGALSGGQRQRVLLARLIVQDADIILLDEPFAGLEAGTTDAMLALMAGWAEAGRLVVAAIHDIDQARTHFPSTVLLTGGAARWGPTRHLLGPPERTPTPAWLKPAVGGD